MQESSSTRQFPCEHCQTAIQIPYDLPPTSAPCPVCGQTTTSPPLEKQIPPVVSVADAGEPLTGKVAKKEEAIEKPSASRFPRVVAAVILLGLFAGAIYLFGKMKAGDHASERQAKVPSGDNPDLVFESAGLAGFEVLRDFFKAPTVEEKAKYVLGGETILPELRAYYRNNEFGSHPSDEPRAEQFIELSLGKQDTDRGIYLLDYHRPRQVKMGEYFTPIMKLEVKLGVEDPDPFTKARAFRDNYEMEASRARVFFKRTDGKLRFDWKTFVQTKDRLLRKFSLSPVPGASQVFRTVASEDVTTILDGDASHRFYRFKDAAHSFEDFVVVRVEKDSEAGRILESLAWTDKPGRIRMDRSATVELKWSDEATPELSVAKVICWEFLGVGGDPSNLNATR